MHLEAKHGTASEVIQTAVVSLGAFMGFVLCIAYPFANWALTLLIPHESLQAGQSILPYAFVALWILIMATVFQSGLDGYQGWVFEVLSAWQASYSIWDFALS